MPVINFATVENAPIKYSDSKIIDLPERMGFCAENARLGIDGGLECKKKCCKKYKRKGWHCRNCPKLG
jgi:hypothetical protein